MLLLTVADPCLLCQNILWANGPMRCGIRSVIILALASLYITDPMRQNKPGDFLGKLGIKS